MMDVAPPIFPDVALDDDTTQCAEWPYLLQPLLYVIGAAVAFWGTALLRLSVRLVSLILAVLHRYQRYSRRLVIARFTLRGLSVERISRREGGGGGVP